MIKVKEGMTKLTEPNIECDLYVGGLCRKSRKGKTKCENCRSDKSWFTDSLGVCDEGEVCIRGSIFGNSYFVITAEQLEQLKQGKVLYDLDEYGTFIMLEQEAP